MNATNLTDFIGRFVRRQRWTFVFIALLALPWTFDLLFWPFFLKKFVDVLTYYELHRFSAWPALMPLLLWGGGAWVFIEGGCRLRDFLKRAPSLS